LLAAGQDPRKRRDVIVRILQVAVSSPPPVGLQLLDVVKPYAVDPEIANAVADVYTRLTPPQATDSKTATLSVGSVADAQKYNSAHPANVSTFSTRVPDATVGGIADVSRVARWQQANGLEADGKIGPATLEVSSREHAGAKTAPDTASAGNTHGSAVSSQTTAKTSKPEYDDATIAAHEAQEKAFDAADPSDHFFRPRLMVDVSPVDVFEAITRKAPGLNKEFRVLMTGQATGEQGHRTNHYNFMGYEFNVARPFGKPPANTPWTRDFRSDRISIAEYNAHPTYYYNWHSYGKTIAQQLADPKTTLLYVLWYAPRPVYANVDEAAGKFVSGIVNWRLHAFQSSKHQHHRDVAAAALTGDVEAYLEMVETSDTELHVLAYNGTNLYKGLMRPTLAKAKADPELAKRP